MSFETLPPMIGEALTERGYTDLTPVQSATIADDAKGRDLIVSAQTGSGKTVAFGLALADALLEETGNLPLVEKPLALVVAPTRELALQVSRELGWLYAKAGLRIATCVGGMDASKERRALRAGPAIVVGTPGRLRDHLERGALDLSGLIGVVLDEADEMLDMGFRDDLEEILDASPETRRTLLFSATMPRPIVRLAERYQQDALRLSLRGEDRGHGDISYQAITVSPAEIENAVVNLLRFHEAETAILFCATRDNVRRFHATLQERGFAAVALSGEHSQSERNQALQALRDKRVRVCVATDVAARGIDLPTLSLVIHVEIPRDAETLQHRSGRTGRAGKKGTAAIIVPYNRRRRVEGMLRGAQIAAEWMDAPSPEQIRKKDRTRLMERLTEPREFSDEDREMAADLLSRMPPEDIAAALVNTHRARLPEPEELVANTPEAREKAKADRHRPGFEDVVWFKIGVGRRQNAEPRWILPLLCRRGHITRNEIGAIRVGQFETWFQIPSNLAGKFADAVARTAGSEDEQDAILIEEAPDGPRIEARQNRRDRGGPGGPGGARVRPKPFGKGPGGKKPGKPFKKGPGAGKKFAGKRKPGKPSQG
ncbi:DEAD/DEAH box helicase [Qipengyuania nanhaisediminis]|uniref:ATP-dependent RNA helicase DeaD n=1 Tax=Qipengyuania nanhaisediminis TaxID=604088 RepID=A0A1I5PM83_9SPHN|nr:DEAD/DEAH box helicase [Qipengyuania nanhaisediminis]SFP34651.1 ATP-dependent RNA helicase DeaD [Qipengyuania nanhaisediminis]